MIGQADINAHLGKRVAPVHVPRSVRQGLASEETWETAEQHLKVCLQFVEEGARKFQPTP
jgi:hypothetical protein